MEGALLHVPRALEPSLQASHGDRRALVPLEPDRDEVMSELEVFFDARSEAGWSVKDSFANLDLSAYGGAVLFEAQWFWCDRAELPRSKTPAQRAVRC